MNNARIGLLMALMMIPSINPIHIYAQLNLNNLNSNQANEMNRIVQVEDQPIWTLSVITILVAAVAIGVTIAVYVYQQKKEANQTRTTILQEIKENKKALLGYENERIAYSVDTAARKKEVNYMNAYLELDAYESGLHSGFIAHLSTHSQHILTALYSVIRSRNALITYIERFEDMFFLLNDSKQSINSWYEKVEKYDRLLTDWEQKIINLLDEAEHLLSKD